MAWFIPVISAVSGFIVRKRVAIVAGTLVVTYYDESWNAIGQFVGEENAESARAELEGLGADVREVGGDAWDATVGEVGGLSLDFIRGVIPAIIDGIAAGYDAIRDGFRGKEPETIAALTIGILVVITVLTIRHEVGTGPSGAGEYA